MRRSPGPERRALPAQTRLATRLTPVEQPIERRSGKSRAASIQAAARSSPRHAESAENRQSGGHGTRTHNPLRGTTFPVSPLAIRLPSKRRYFRLSTPLSTPCSESGRSLAGRITASEEASLPSGAGGRNPAPGNAGAIFSMVSRSCVAGPALVVTGTRRRRGMACLLRRGSTGTELPPCNCVTQWAGNGP